MNGTVLLLSGQAPLPVVTYDQFVSGVNSGSAGNVTINASASPTPAPTLYPQYGVSAQDLEVLRQFLIDQENAKQNAQVDAEVLKQMNDYSCFLSSERKSDYYSKWLSLTDLGKNCLPYFLALNSTNADAFSRTCSFFGADQDPAGAYYGASYVLDEYVRKGLGDMRVQKFKSVVLLDESGDTSTSIRNVPFYYPTQMSAGCLAEFEKTKSIADTSVQDGFSTGLVVLLFLFFIILILLLYWSGK